MALACRTGEKAGAERSRGLPVTGPSFSSHPLSTPVCPKDKGVNTAEVPACMKHIVRGTLEVRSPGSELATVSTT